MQYLGHILDTQTLHFEHENCPACSLGKDNGGKLVRGKYNWQENDEVELLVIPVYDKNQQKIVYIQMLRNNFSSDEMYAEQLDKIGYLYCSRYPNCKYFVTINKSVLLDDPLLLLDAQHAYRTS